MKNIFTRHAQKRIRKRNIASRKVKHLMNVSEAKYLGGHKYKASRTLGGRKVTVVYKKEGGRKVAVTSWKN